MQCDSREGIPLDETTNVRDPRIPAEWNVLVDLCSGYQRGLGLFCGTRDEAMMVFSPWSPLFTDPEASYLGQFCVENCWCLERPDNDDVTQAAGARNRGPAPNGVGYNWVDWQGIPLPPVGGMAVRNFPEGYSVDPNWQRGVVCSREMFGEPSADDCDHLVQELADILDLDWPWLLYEFAELETPRRFPDDTLFALPYRKVQGESALLITTSHTNSC